MGICAAASSDECGSRPRDIFFFVCLLFIIYMKLGKYIKVHRKIMYEVCPRPIKGSKDSTAFT